MIFISLKTYGRTLEKLIATGVGWAWEGEENF